MWLVRPTGRHGWVWLRRAAPEASARKGEPKVPELTLANKRNKCDLPASDKRCRVPAACSSLATVQCGAVAQPPFD